MDKTKFDRIYGGLLDVSLKTSPTTIKAVQPITGESETWIIQTLRHEDGDTVFIEHIDGAGVVREALPPKVIAAIVRHRDSLTTRSRSIRGKASIAARQAAGEVIGFRKKQA